MWRKMGERRGWVGREDGDRCSIEVYVYVFFRSLDIYFFTFFKIFVFTSNLYNSIGILSTLRRYKTQKCDPSRGKVRTTANCGCGGGGSRQQGAELQGDAH